MSSSLQEYNKVFHADTIATQYNPIEQANKYSAQRLVEESGVLTAFQPRIVLDNACGTGIVSILLNAEAEGHLTASDELVLGDISDGMVTACESRCAAWPHARAQKLDAQALGLPDSHFSHVITHNSIMLLPDPFKALREIKRVLRPGGINAYAVPTDPGWPFFVKEAFRRLPGIPPYPSSTIPTGAWEDPAFNRKTLEEAGFIDVQAALHVVDFRMPDAASLIDLLKFFYGAICRIQAGWTEQQLDEWLPRLWQQIQIVVEEHFGKGEIVMPYVTMIAVGRKALH